MGLIDLSDLASTNQHEDKPVWLYILVTLTVIGNFVVIILVPRKKRHLKDETVNKSYSIPSDQILSLTGVVMLTSATYGIASLIYWFKLKNCSGEECHAAQSYIEFFKYPN